MSKLTRITHEDEKRQNMIRFLLTVWRRWGVMSLITGAILAAAGCAVAIAIVKPKYEAKLFFHVIEDRAWTDVRGLGDRQDPGTVKSWIKSEIIASRVSVDESVASLPEIQAADNRADKLDSMTDVTAIGGPLYAIRAVSTVPQNAAVIAQAYWNHYNLQHQSFKDSQSKAIREVLDGESSFYRDRLNTLEDELQKMHDQMARSESAVSIGPTGETAYSMLSKLEQALEDNESKILITKNRIRDCRENPEDTEFKRDDLAIELDALTEVMQATSRLNAAKVELEKTAWRYGPSSYTYKSVKSTVDLAERELKRVRSAGLDKLKARKRRDGEELDEDELEELQQQLDELEVMQVEIGERIAEEKEKVRAYNKLKFDYDRKNEEIKNEREDYLALRRQERDLRLRQIAPFNVKREGIVSPDEPVPVPKRPIEKYPVKQMAAISVLSMALPFIFFGLWEMQVKRISFSEQLDHPVKVIGEVAGLPSRFNRAARRWQQSQVFEESVNGISAFLMSRPPEEEIRSLAVTSAVSNEGKTTLSAQLAISLARTSAEPVLLIDADLRRPTIHRVFDVDMEPGLSEVLAGNISLSDAVEPCKLNNLDLLSGGILRENPHRLMGQDKLAQLIREAENKYAFVIIDTPPVLSASETLMAAGEADATILCVMRDVSRIEVVNRAFNRLSNSMVNVIGYVFSGVPQTHYAKRYGGYEYVKPRITG